MSRPEDETNATVVLRVTMGGGMRNAREDHARLREALDSFDAIEIDFEDLGLIDVSTLQLVISAEKSAARRGKALALTRHAAGAVAAAAKRAGLLGEFSDGPVPGDGMEAAVP